jgi:hypothetical protein
MKLTREQLSSIEPIGKTQDGSEILHVQTKGGRHMMVKRQNGDLKILGEGAHRGHARFMSNQLEKGIMWHESLYKSEDDQYKPNSEVIQVVESTPDKHTAVAVYHTYQAQKEADPLSKIAMTDSALSHFKAAGLTIEQSTEMFYKTTAKLQKSYIIDEPYDSEMLRVAYERKYKKPFPSGIEG